MTWVVIVLAVVVAVLTVAAVLGRVDGSLADATTTMSHVPLPEDRLTTDDLDGLRFDTAVRGYRMSQVDAVVDRLRHEIAVLGDDVDRLRATLAPPTDGLSPAPRPEPRQEPVGEPAAEPAREPALHRAGEER